MADVTTSINTGAGNMTLRPFAYSGYSEKAREISAIARSELRFTWSITVAAPGVGNNQVISISTSPNMPGTFSYVLMDAFIAMEGTSAETNDWDPVANGRLVNGDGSYDVRFGLPSDGVSTRGPNGFEARHWCANRNCTPSFTMINNSASTSALTILARNQTADSVAYNCSGMIRMLVYDVGQSHWFDVNTPQLTR